jgi:hypothetical protein
MIHLLQNPVREARLHPGRVCEARAGDAKCDHSVSCRYLETALATDGVNCPAVFIDEETGDLLLQGWEVGDPDPGAGGTAQPAGRQ